MRILANENVPGDTIEALRQHGHDIAVAVAVLGSRHDWTGHFSVVEDTRIRMTPLPPSS